MHPINFRVHHRTANLILVSYIQIEEVISTEGFIGDLWKLLMFVVFVGFTSLLAAFLFHFSEISSYQRQANSILQDSTYIPSYSSQFDTYSPNNTSADAKLARLDEKYKYEFMIRPTSQKEAKNKSLFYKTISIPANKVNKYKNKNITVSFQGNTYKSSVQQNNGKYYYKEPYIHMTDNNSLNNDASPAGFNNGSRMYYHVLIQIPYQDLSKNYVTRDNKNHLTQEARFYHQLISETICQTNSDNQ